MNYAAELSCGAALVFSSALLAEGFLPRLIDCYVLQSVAVVVVSLSEAWRHDSAVLCLIGVSAIAVKCFAAPIALRQVVEHLRLSADRESGPGFFSLATAGPALFLLSWEILRETGTAQNARSLFAVALSVVLIGQLMIALRRLIIFQFIGFLCLENGLMLAAIGAGGAALWTAPMIAPAALLIFAAAGMRWLHPVLRNK